MGPLWTGSRPRAGRARSGHGGVPCGQGSGPGQGGLGQGSGVGPHGQGPGPGQGGLSQGGGGSSGCRQPGLVLVSTGPQRNGKTILVFSEEFVIHVTLSGALSWERDAWSGLGLSSLRPVPRVLASLAPVYSCLCNCWEEAAVNQLLAMFPSLSSLWAPESVPSPKPGCKMPATGCGRAPTLVQTPHTAADLPNKGRPPHQGQPHHRGRYQGGRPSRGHWSPEGLFRVGFLQAQRTWGVRSRLSAEHTSLLPVDVLFREAPGVSLPFLFLEVRPRFLKASSLIRGAFVLWRLGGAGAPDKDAAPHFWA